MEKEITQEMRWFDIGVDQHQQKPNQTKSKGNAISSEWKICVPFIVLAWFLFDFVENAIKT